MTSTPPEIIAHPRLFEILDETIERHQQMNMEFALLIISINRFREINIAHGFHEGDLLLKEIHEAIGSVARNQDKLFRVGSAEFIMLIPNLHNDGQATLAAIRLLDCFANAFDISGSRISAKANIGCAVFPTHGQNSQDLLRNSEVALIDSRQRKESFSIYSGDEEAEDTTSWDIDSELQSAIDNDELELHLQPLVDLRSNELLGAESLLRWKHPERGYIAPGNFIPVAERSGLVHRINDWTIRAAFWLIREWPETSLPLTIAVNLSSKVLEQGLVETITRAANMFGTDLSRLVLEITESALMEDMVSSFQVLEELKSMGVRISIDDFGTGYSTMSFFKNIPADELKIDQSFVSNLLKSPADMHIVRSIIEMSKGFGLKVVAEGIEDGETFETLRMLGCDTAQGWYVAKPMPQLQFIEWTHQYIEAIDLIAAY